MVTLTLQDIKRHGSKSIPDDAPAYLIVNSKPKCVMVPVEQYEKLMEMLEDLDDLRVIEERKNDELVPFEEAQSWFE
ncbi:type II toxin-antitoxin system Phd/YefM family antitoxin [Patescibacteria group bacterium]|nr:type II toxin-antitoxin system Phd/YefM family antitoxin [Patescibacteria group bacterium]MBU1123115.1 type II toxin-antitoxin system Phd/YefM family antitoxin [Patescibacteria group bacterium]